MSCEDDYAYKYHTTNTAKIKKKVILLCTTSPLCQCGAQWYHQFYFCSSCCVIFICIVVLTRQCKLFLFFLLYLLFCCVNMPVNYSLPAVRNCSNVRDPYELPDFWPLNSPDLKYISLQNLGQRVYQTKALDVNDLRQHLIDVWVEVKRSMIDSGIDVSMPAFELQEDITVCAVAQHCYNGDVSFLWEKWKLWPL